MNKQYPGCYSKYLGVGVLIICAVLFVVSTYGVYRQTEAVDLNSGLLRQRKSIWGVTVHEEIIQTEIARFSKHDTPPEWRIVSTTRLWPLSFQPFHGYFDFRYGGFPTDIKNLDTLWHMYSFPEDQQRETARAYMSILKTNATSASRYIWRLNEDSLSQFRNSGSPTRRPKP